MVSRVYLDNAAAALPSPEQMKAVAEDLQQLQLTNPHSRHSNSRTVDIIDNAREMTLKFFNTDAKKYHVVFTSGATHALHMLADFFNFNCGPTACSEVREGIPDRNSGGNFVYMLDSHTSVIGMRELVRSRCSSIYAVDFDYLYKALSKTQVSEPPAACEDVDDGNDLFVITAMSNFCGHKYPLDVIQKIHQWRPDRSFVALDVSSWVSTSYLDLSSYQPDFVTFSFYKIFGYPTGIGALLIRTDGTHLLQKRYFGGGTVKLVVPDALEVYPRDNFIESFEDGTVNFWAIAALKRGFEDISRYGGIGTIQQKTYALAAEAYRILKELKFLNGKPLVDVYCSHENYGSSEIQGPIVAFNLLQDDGSYTGYSEFEKFCDLYRIEARTGCFCNQGACQRYLKLTRQQLIHNYKHKGKQCGDQNDIIDGQPVGAIRISFGRQSTEQDLQVLRDMLESCFLLSSWTQQSTSIPTCLEKNEPFLSALYLYPIKGCSSISTDSWEISKTGLAYDRCWMVAKQNGLAMNQKRIPRLCLVKPEIRNEELWISSKEGNEKEILHIPLLNSASNLESEEQRVCFNRVETTDCGDEAANWLDRVLHESGCRLRRQYDMSKSETMDGHLLPHGLSNSAPYLLINRSSAAYLASIVGLPVDQIIRRFRPNFVIDHLPPFCEDQIKELTIGDIQFEVLRSCVRCQIICIDQETGEKQPDLLVALRKFRLDHKEKIMFGIYLQHKRGCEGSVIRKGDKFRC